ncbi:4Fe-4S cluster-binding domain-containing protein [Candidatus Heimdallarchaeota archaeon]|nr:MAG: 4Fe-4S cluster-binding domain-containing protein [Candidatus Heimdallarchaeota archaeon]
MKLVKRMNKLKHYLYEVQLKNGDWFVFNLLNFNYIISNRGISATDTTDLEESVIETLHDLGFISEYSEDSIFKNELDKWKAKILTEYNPVFEILTFRILPTYSCNFRCSYCYQPELLNEETRKKTEYMNEEVLIAFFDYLENDILSERIPKIRIEVVGGEVFLRNRKAIVFVRKIIEKSIDHNMDLIFVTNGYELDYFFEILKQKYTITYNITIDGNRTKHNQRRYLIGKSGSFDKIIDNIDWILRNTKHIVRIRMNVDDNNVESVTPLITILKEKEWIDLDRLEIIIRTTTKYVDEPYYGLPVAYNIISQNNTVRLIRSIIASNIKKIRIDGTLIPPVAVSLFWSKLFNNGKNNVAANVKSFDLLCSSNQGHFGSLDFDGQVRLCGFELAHSCGRIYPHKNLDEELIKEWNSKEHILRKFLLQPCLKCKFFFLCSKRQCPYNQLNNYDKETGYCVDVKESLDLFFKNFGNYFI